ERSENFAKSTRSIGTTPWICPIFWSRSMRAVKWRTSVMRAGWSCDRISSDDIGEELRRWFETPLKSGAVHLDQTELGPVAERPFKVVEETPVRVDAHVDSFVETVRDPRQCNLHVLDSLCVVVGADAIFGDEDRHRAAGVLPGSPYRGGECLRVVLVAEWKYGN